MAGYNIPGSTPNPADMRRYRSDAGQEMTDSQYAQWKQSVQQGRRQTDAQEAAAARNTAAGQVGATGGTASVDPTGAISYEVSGPGPMGASIAGLRAAAQASGTRASSGQDDELARMRESARLQAEAEQRRFSMMSGQSQPTAKVAPVDTSAARAAAFARAKDQAGQIARSSLDSLYNLMAASGRAGSNIEASEASNILEGTAGDLGDVVRQGAITEADEAQQEALANYQGGITQRGQDLARQQSLLSLITARGLY